MTQKALTLNANVRTTVGKGLNDLRLKGKIPAVLYGHKIENINLEIDEIELQKLLNKISESDLVDLKIDNKEPIKVLFQEISRDILKNSVNHLDFYQVNMHEKIKTEIELNFVGESPAVKDLGGILVKTLDHIEVECLPGDLISRFDIDLSLLKEIGSIIRAKDLIIPDTLTLLTDPETVLVLTEEPKKEVEKTLEATATTEMPTEAQDNKTEEQKEK